MTREQTTRRLRELLDENGLTEWKIRIATSVNKPYLGLCDHNNKTIFINGLSVDTHPDSELENTLRHEVAHALVGPGHSHDETWQAKAKELGCDNTMTCGMALSPLAIDAIRSGATLEMEIEEQVVRTAKYKVTRLQDKCPVCGKVAKELKNWELANFKFIQLDCGHLISKELPKQTPYETLVSNGWKPEIASCNHVWGTSPKNQCVKCGEFKLFDYQVIGARFIERALAVGRGGAIFDEQGLGKTPQSLAYLKFHDESLPVLFILKSGLKYQFQSEIVRWMGDKYFAQVIAGSNDYLIPGLKCYIVSYDLLVFKQRPGKKGKVITQGFDINRFEQLGIKTVVLDECQAIKNVDSGRTQQVRRIVAKAQHVIPLSGTPWKNRGNEFFPVLNMLDPTKFYSNQAFLNRWVATYYDGNRVKMGGIQNIPEFKEYTKDILIRRERAEVMKELPIIQRNKFHCQIEDHARKAYENEVSEFVKWYNNVVISGEEDSFQSSQNIVAKLQRMRHILGLAKIPTTVEFVTDHIEETGRKIVVFVHHKDVGELILFQLKKELPDVPVIAMTASLSSEERFNMQRQFNETDKIIMVASTLAAGEGLNLQTCCDCVIHERQWNPANEEQAEGRFIRIGQQSEHVTATYVHVENSVDMNLDSIVERKRIDFHNSMNKGELVKWTDTGLMKELAESLVRDFGRK